MRRFPRPASRLDAFTTVRVVSAASDDDVVECVNRGLRECAPTTYSSPFDAEQRRWRVKSADGLELCEAELWWVPRAPGDDGPPRVCVTRTHGSARLFYACFGRVRRALEGSPPDPDPHPHPDGARGPRFNVAVVRPTVPEVLAYLTTVARNVLDARCASECVRAGLQQLGFVGDPYLDEPEVQQLLLRAATTHVFHPHFTVHELAVLLLRRLVDACPGLVEHVGAAVHRRLWDLLATVPDATVAFAATHALLACADVLAKCAQRAPADREADAFFDAAPWIVPALRDAVAALR